ncbi:hypothetical protein PWT90_09344 [Aphanocladium album]|nr:hypothetical protein PWT90_09344 [Aphanocladium album]
MQQSTKHKAQSRWLTVRRVKCPAVEKGTQGARSISFPQANTTSAGSQPFISAPPLAHHIVTTAKVAEGLTGRGAICSSSEQHAGEPLLSGGDGKLADARLSGQVPPRNRRLPDAVASLWARYDQNLGQQHLILVLAHAQAHVFVPELADELGCLIGWAEAGAQPSGTGGTTPSMDPCSPTTRVVNRTHPLLYNPCLGRD